MHSSDDRARQNAFPRILRGVTFLGLLLLLSAGVAQWYGHFVMGKSLLRTSEGQYKSRTAEARYLIFGDSHAMVAVNPELFEGAFVLASPGENYIQTYYRLRRVIAEGEGRIRAVFLPLDLHSFSSFRTDDRRNAYFWVDYMDYLEVGRRKGKLLPYLAANLKGRLFPFLGGGRYVVRWMKGQRGTKLIRGYLPRTRDFSRMPHRERGPRKQVERHLSGKNPLDRDLLAYFRLSIMESRRLGVEVILVRYPVADAYLREALRLVAPEEFYRQALSGLSDLPGVKVWDYQSIFSGREDLFSDSHHLNTRRVRNSLG